MQKPVLYQQTKSGYVIMPQTIELFAAYAEYFVKASCAELTEYERTHDSSHQNDAGAVRLQQAIERARYVLEEITCLRGAQHKLFQWNFVRLAEAFRQVRIVLRLANIEEMYSLKLALYYVCGMLNEENPKFNYAKFIQAVNTKDDTEAETQKISQTRRTL